MRYRLAGSLNVCRVSSHAWPADCLCIVPRSTCSSRRRATVHNPDRTAGRVAVGDVSRSSLCEATARPVRHTDDPCAPFPVTRGAGLPMPSDDTKSSRYAVRWRVRRIARRSRWPRRCAMERWRGCAAFLAQATHPIQVAAKDPTPTRRHRSHVFAPDEYPLSRRVPVVTQASRRLRHHAVTDQTTTAAPGTASADRRM